MRHVIASIVLGVALAAQGQQEAPRAESWTGSFSYQASRSGKSANVTYSYEGVSKGTFVLDTFRDTPDRYAGSVHATFSFHMKTITDTGGNCTDEEEFNGEGSPVVVSRGADEATLVLRQSTWMFRLGTVRVDGTIVRRTICGDEVRTSSRPSPAQLPTDSPLLPYPATGARLTASFEASGILPLTVPPEAQRVIWQGQVSVEPGTACQPLRSACDQVTSWKQCAESSIAGLQDDLGVAQAQLVAEFAARSSSPEQMALWEPQYLQIKQQLGDLLIYVVKLRGDLAVQATQAQADCALLPGPANRKECDGAARRVDEGLKTARQKVEGDFDGPQMTAFTTALQAQGGPWPSVMALLARMPSRQKLIHQCPS
jgi:hypothetical protein